MFDTSCTMCNTDINLVTPKLSNHITFENDMPTLTATDTKNKCEDKDNLR